MNELDIKTENKEGGHEPNELPIDSPLEDLRGKELQDIIPEELKPIINRLPHDEKTRVEAMLALTIKKSWSGPMPSPETLGEYNEIIPNGAERIFLRSEKQSDHRMELEKLAISSELKQSERGQLYGLIIAILFLIGSFVLVLMGFEVAGSIIGTVDILGLVSVFVLGRKSQEKDLENKR